MNKEPFKFSYTVPTYDWFEEIKVEIPYDKYNYFRIERRYGPSWWIIGLRYTNDWENPWNEEQLGKITTIDLKRFIEWAKTERGNKVTDITAISSDFNILEEIQKILL